MTRGSRTASVCGLVVALALGLATFGYRYLSFSGFANDHFIHLTMAQQMTLGELPVRDYVERGMPLMAAASAAAQVMLGPGLRAELALVSMAFAASAVLLCIVAVAISRSVVTGLLAASATVVAYPVSYSYPKLFVYALAFAAALLYVRRPQTGPRALLALTIVVAFLFRHDHGGFLAAGAIGMLLVLHGATRRGLTVVGRFVALCLLVASPYLVWVQVWDGVVVYATDGVEFFRHEAERSSWFAPPEFGIDLALPLLTRVEQTVPVVNVRWRADLSDAAVGEREGVHRLVRLEAVGPNTWQYELRVWSSPALEALVRDPAAVDTQGIDRSRYRLSGDEHGPLAALLVRVPRAGAGLRLQGNAVAAMFYIAWAVPLIALAALFRAHAVPIGARALAVMASIVQLAMNLTMLRDPLGLRVRDVVAPLSIALAFCVGRAWGSGGSGLVTWTIRSAAAILLATTVGAAAVLGAVDDRLDGAGVWEGPSGVLERWQEIERELAPPAHRMGRVPEAYPRLIDYIDACTPVRARLFAMTFAPELLFYAGRGFAGGQVAMMPEYWASDRHATLMLDRLSREDVPFVILDTETEEAMVRLHPRVMQHVRAAYHQVAEFPLSGPKKLLLLGENRRTPVRVFGPDRLPCYA
jgi:hypothetical protein